MPEGSSQCDCGVRVTLPVHNGEALALEDAEIKKTVVRERLSWSGSPSQYLLGLASSGKNVHRQLPSTVEGEKAEQVAITKPPLRVLSPLAATVKAPPKHLADS